MAISIKDPETDRLARELAAATGETLTDEILGYDDHGVPR